MVPQDQVREAAQKLAAEIAENAPLAILATRLTMRAGLADRVEGRDRARAEIQTRLRATKISRRASRRWPSAACRTSRGGKVLRSKY
jgi:enoyl-CoA hydratase/carnithine racemase